MRCGIERGRGSEAGELADLQRSVGVSVIADGIEGYVILPMQRTESGRIPLTWVDWFSAHGRIARSSRTPR